MPLRRQKQHQLGLILEVLYKDRPGHEARRTVDPVLFPHRYDRMEDIEVAGLVAATLAFGRVDLFKPVVEKILSRCGPHPADYLARFDIEVEASRYRGVSYRMCREKDIVCWLYFLGKVLKRYGSLGNLFIDVFKKENDLKRTLDVVTEIFLTLDPTPVLGKRSLSRGLLQMIPSPRHGGPCKRWNMFLRWMVRPSDGVDFGLWKEIPASQLVIPLDTHIARISRYLGMTRRKTANWKMAEEITDALRRLDPQDPVKFDFALCHVGISGECPARPEPANCMACRLNPVCQVGRSFARKAIVKSRKG